MKKRFSLRWISLVVSAVIFSCSTIGVYAEYQETASVKNEISVGDINIRLSEYEIIRGKERPYRGKQVVLPGQQLSKIVRVENLADTCWVRAKITYQNKSDRISVGLSDRNLMGLSDEWTKIGEYYYLTNPLFSHQSSDLFTGVEIPSSWDSSHQGQELGISIQMDAIQAYRFVPDFTAMSPWGNQPIETCIHEEGNPFPEEKSPVTFRVVYQDGAEKLVAGPDNFFQNMGRLLPGMTVEDQAQIRNTTDEPTELWFYTGYQDQTQEQIELLEHLELTLFLKDQLLYQGDLKADSLSNGISLGEFPPGVESVLTYQIRMPKELKNEYALRDAEVLWIFQAKNGHPTSRPSISPSGTQNNSSHPNPVKTSDESHLLTWILLMAFSAAAFFLILFIPERRNNL